MQQESEPAEEPPDRGPQRAPLRTNRVLARAALVLYAFLLLITVETVADRPVTLLLVLMGLALMSAGVWAFITERMPRRGLGAGAAAVGLVMVIVTIGAILTGGMLLTMALLAAAATVSARLAVAETLHAIDLEASLPARRPHRPVLICNPASGGGKVAQFDIIERARALGVEVVELRPGMDLEQIARDAVARGADCLGMAGGDGSQALVASVAAAHGIPFVCISAGTRNHFAADLGIDRADPAAGLQAFRSGVLRRVDYGRAGDRVFVNNVSLGVYASVIEREGYRDAKLATALEALPGVVGPGAARFDLQVTAPDGREIDGPLMVLVSNNPYALTRAPGLVQRRSLTTGELGVVVIAADHGEDARQVVARIAGGLVRPDPNVLMFGATEFEVRARSGSMAAGIDGEALEVPGPLRLRIVPKGLILLVPTDTIEVAARRRYRELGVRGLWDIARGREPDVLRVLH